MLSNYLNFFVKMAKKWVFNWLFFKWTENSCRRAESAYSRANGKPCHDFSFCVEIGPNHGPSASTSAPDVMSRGLQNFEGPEYQPPGPATALPYTWGDYYIKLNT